MVKNGDSVERERQRYGEPTQNCMAGPFFSYSFHRLGSGLEVRYLARRETKRRTRGTQYLTPGGRDFGMSV